MGAPGVRREEDDKFAPLIQLGAPMWLNRPEGSGRIVRMGR